MNDAINMKCYSMAAAARVTGLSRTLLYQAVSDGSLRTFKRGRRRLVRETVLSAFVDRLEREGGDDRVAA